MQTLETLKRSIQSAEDLAGVVRTMKTMAAVSIRQYETAAKSLDVYAHTIETGLGMLLRHSDDRTSSNEIESAKTGAIIFGSDQGMCGQFNEQISELAFEYLRMHSMDLAPAICIGYRVADKVAQRSLKVDQVLRLPGSAAGLTGLIQKMLPAIDTWRASHQIERILVFHNRRLSASTWEPFAQQLLPLRLDRLLIRHDSETTGRSLPHWTMNTSELFSRFIKQFLFVTLYRACAESLAGENASRIAAMQSAERNIKDRLHLLRGDYSQQRQTAITEELLDVVTGFEALRQPE